MNLYPYRLTDHHGGTTMNRDQAASDNAAARSVTAARVVSVRAFRKQRLLDLAAEQGAGQGQLAYVRVRKARTLALALFLAGAA
jgi:hypothetical protein